MDDPGTPLSIIALELGGERAHVRVVGNSSTRVRDVQQDSRRVVGGDLFVARSPVGASADSREAAEGLERFTAEAIARGAAGVMRAPPPLREGRGGRGETMPAVPTIEVPNDALPAAIGVAASAVHRHPSYVVEVIGVTGTNGKTTTTSLVADALDHLNAENGEAASSGDCALIGTLGVRLGAEAHPTTHTTPEGDEIARILAWARDRGAKHAAMEVSSHALDQRRLAGTRVRVAAFTNLTQDHLDYHRTMEAYFAAKERLFDELHPGGVVVCVDDAWGVRLADAIHHPRLRVSARADARADVRALEARVDARGVQARVATPSGEVEISSVLLGRHNLANVLVALGILLVLGVDARVAAPALGVAKAPRGRLELASDPARDDVVVLVDYAHSPDALARALAAARTIAPKRLWCIFGCGGDRDATKRGAMGRAVAEAADVAVVTSDNPRTEDPRAIVQAIVEAMHDLPVLAVDALEGAQRGVHVEVDRARAIARSIAAAAPGDVVLIAGKGHETCQIVGAEKRPFDDRSEALRALAARGSGSRGGA